MAQVPWYADQGSVGFMKYAYFQQDQLHHQRAADRDSKWDDIHSSYKRGQFIGQATKYRKVEFNFDSFSCRVRARTVVP